ncbi:unnamed protein product [Clonostachys rosea]|uniref:Uncharacterized protein n=1 Tax=Bionectria ochroleuca TaxID=29856 RepID=A0ABY6U9G0_BIOOC|nr:unnamed protein product [Clonostachys rosea]
MTCDDLSEPIPVIFDREGTLAGCRTPGGALLVRSSDAVVMEHEEQAVIADGRSGYQAILEVTPRCRQGDIARDRSGWPTGIVAGVARQIACKGSCGTPAAQCANMLFHAISSSAEIMRDSSRRLATEAFSEMIRDLEGSGITIPQYPPAVSRCRMWDGLPTNPQWPTTATQTIWGSAGRTLGLQHKATWEVKTEWRCEFSSPCVSTSKHQPPGGALYYVEESTEVKCASPGASFTQATANTLTTFTRVELFSPAVETPDEYQQLVGVALMADSRSAAVIFTAAEMVLMTAHLLEIRRMALHGESLSAMPGLTVQVEFEVPKIELRGLPPPKLSGVANVASADFAYLKDLTDAEGPLANICSFSMAAGYNLFVYGGTLGGLWSELDCMFLIGNTPNVQAALGRRFTNLFDHFHGNSALEAHVRTVGTVMDCNYIAIKAKARMEDSCIMKSRPVMCIWGDLDVLARYRALDAVFGHPVFDSRGDGESYAMAGLCVALHDLLDLGADLA